MRWASSSERNTGGAVGAGPVEHLGAEALRGHEPLVEPVRAAPAPACRSPRDGAEPLVVERGEGVVDVADRRQQPGADHVDAGGSVAHS